MFPSTWPHVRYLRRHCLHNRRIKLEQGVIYFITKALYSSETGDFNEDTKSHQCAEVDVTTLGGNSEVVSNASSDGSTSSIDGLPPEPTMCCMSGCANCVWLIYAEEMSKHFQDGGEAAITEIEEKVQDPNIKAYLLTELRMRLKNKDN